MIITVASGKGGTAKSASCGSLAQCAIKDGKKVLTVDMDPQSSLSIWLKADLSKENSFDLIQGEDIKDVIQTTESKIDCIPGNASLSALKTAPASGRRLEKALQAVKKEYDLIIVDSPPTISEAFYNSIYAADSILVPVEADTQGIQAIYQLYDTLTHVKANKPTLEISGIVITRYDKRSRITRYMREQIEAKCKDLNIPYLGEIRRSIAISECMAMRENLFDYAGRSHAAEDYKELYRRLFSTNL